MKDEKVCYLLCGGQCARTHVLVVRQTPTPLPQHSPTRAGAASFRGAHDREQVGRLPAAAW
jgi:hypothetical protein